MTSFEYFWNCSRFFDHSMQMSGKIPVSLPSVVTVFHPQLMLKVWQMRKIKTCQLLKLNF